MKKEKTGGRKRGTANKVTTELREKVSMLIDDLHDSVVEDMKDLSVQDRIKAMIALLEFSLPKLQRTDNKHSIDFENMSAKDIDLLFDRLIKKPNSDE